MIGTLRLNTHQESSWLKALSFRTFRIESIQAMDDISRLQASEPEHTFSLSDIPVDGRPPPGKSNRLYGISTVTTDDTEVRKQLRKLGQPITLFGEGPADRRNRLKELLAALGTDVIERRDEEPEKKTEKGTTETTWYHEGPESLHTSRLWLAHYSLPRAKERLARAKEELNIPESTRTAKR